MRTPLLTLLLLCPLLAFGQGKTVHFVHSLNELLSANAPALATAGKATVVVHNTNDLWALPRVARWHAGSTLTSNGTNVFESPFGGRWIFDDTSGTPSVMGWTGSTEEPPSRLTLGPNLSIVGGVLDASAGGGGGGLTNIVIDFDGTSVTNPQFVSTTNVLWDITSGNQISALLTNITGGLTIEEIIDGIAPYIVGIPPIETATDGDSIFISNRLFPGANITAATNSPGAGDITWNASVGAGGTNTWTFEVNGTPIVEPNLVDSTYVTINPSGSDVPFDVQDLDVPRGGTGATTFDAGEFLFGDGANPISTLPASPGIFTDSTGVWGGYIFDPAGFATSTNGNLITVTNTGAGGGALSDGDYTDITVSGSGTIWNIDADTVGANELQSTTVTPGPCTNCDLTIDADGRITASANGTGGGGTGITIEGAMSVWGYAQFHFVNDIAGGDFDGTPVVSNEVTSVSVISGDTSSPTIIELGFTAIADTNYFVLYDTDVDSNVNILSVVDGSRTTTSVQVEVQANGGNASDSFKAKVAIVRHDAVGTIGEVETLSVDDVTTQSLSISNYTGLAYISSGVVTPIANDSAGEVLTMVGGVPAWAPKPGYYVLTGGTTETINPADNTIYYAGGMNGISLNPSATIVGIPIPVSGTIIGYAVGARSGTAGSAEDVTYNLRLNNTTDFGTLIHTWAATVQRTSITGLSQTVTAGDDVQLKVTAPVNWVTNPLGSYIWFNITVQH